MFLALQAVTACALFRPVSESGNDVVSARFDDGFPKWVDMPRHGLKEGMIGGVGRSDLADVDVESAKSEAELIARNKIAQELESNIRSVVSRETANANAKTRSEAAKFKKINEERISNIVSKRIVGSRVDEYLYINTLGKVDRVNPKTVYVRVILDVDIKSLATDLGANELTEAEQAAFTQVLVEEFTQVDPRSGEAPPVVQ